MAAHCLECPGRAGREQLRSVQRSVACHVAIACRHGYVVDSECSLKASGAAVAATAEAPAQGVPWRPAASNQDIFTGRLLRRFAGTGVRFEGSRMSAVQLSADLQRLTDPRFVAKSETRVPRG